MKAQSAAILCLGLLSTSAFASKAPIGAEVEQPSIKFVKQAAQEYIDENSVCAVISLDGLYSRASQWENGVHPQHMHLFFPFLRAGLLEDAGTTNHGLRRLKVTRQGARRLKECLLDADAYPEKVTYGFRVAHRQISDIDQRDLKSPAIKIECLWFKSVKVFYQLKFDADWFDPTKFITNIHTYATDDRGIHFVKLSLYSSGNGWNLGDITDPHHLPICLSDR